MPRLRPAPKASIDELDPSESMSGLFEAKEKEPESDLHENKPEEPEVEVKEPEKQEDPALALQKQLDELKKSEELQRTQNAQIAKERDEAIKRAQERETEVTKLQKENTQSSYNAITSDLATSQANADRAAQDVEIAGNASDFKGLADAQRRLARAESEIVRLEGWKFELETQLKAEKAEPKVEPKVESKQENKLPDVAVRYIERHPELLHDPRKNVKLQSLHWEAIDAGNEAYTPPYFEFLDLGLGYKKVEPKVEEQQRTNIVSAPVSREVPSGGTGVRSNGKVTLSAQEREFAKLSGVTEAEYAKQKQMIAEMRANGTYDDGRK
jgi:hypothetical protein